MEDEQYKIVVYIKYIKLIIIIILIGVIAFFGYTFIAKKINAKNFENYLVTNNFTKENDGTFTKEIKDESNDYNSTKYKAFFENSIMSKEINKQDENNYINMIIWFKKNNDFTVELQLDGPNKYDEYGLLYQKGKYKNGKFSCKIIAGESYNTQCKLMKEEVIAFKKEIDNILKQSHVNSKYIKK